MFVKIPENRLVNLNNIIGVYLDGEKIYFTETELDIVAVFETTQQAAEAFSLVEDGILLGNILVDLTEVCWFQFQFQF